MIRVFAPALVGLGWCALVIVFLSVSSRSSAGGDEAAGHQTKHVPGHDIMFSVRARNLLEPRTSPLVHDLAQRDRTTGSDMVKEKQAV